MRFAFELARRRDKARHVTSVTKSNAQRHSMVFWDDIFKEVAADYPDVETSSNLVGRGRHELYPPPGSL